MINKSRKRLTNLAILSISLIITSGNAISPALPSIAKSFPKIPVDLVDMIGTVQQFAVVFALFISAVLARKIGIKKTISSGIILVGLSGVLPLVSDSFGLIILSRIILGIGIGFFNSLAIDIINIYYQHNKKKRIQTIGIRTAFEPLGTCVLTLVAGALVIINWHLAFIIYFTAFPVLWFFYHFVPDIQPETESSHHQKRPVNWKKLFGFSTIALTLMMAYMCVVNTAIAVQIPNIFYQKSLGSSELSSITISLNTLASMLMGFAFGKVFSKLHRFTLPLGMAFMAAGTVIVAFANSSGVLMIGSILEGCAFPLSGSFIYAWIGSSIPKAADIITSVVLVGCNLGTFISPIATGILERVVTSHASVEHAFLMMCLISIVIGIAITFIQVTHIMKERNIR